MNWVTEGLLRRFRYLASEEQSGQGLVEYAMIIMLVVVATVGALTALGGAQQGKLWNPIMAGLRSIGMM